MTEFPVAGGFHPDDEPATEAESTLGVKEYRNQFAANAPILEDGVSIDRRTDAISLDYLTCFTLGPIQLADFSAGPIDRPWRIRAVGNVVYSARLNAARSGFDPEVELFRFAGVPPTEIDAAFDQAARILVCMERATGPGNTPELWVYFYDPLIPGYTLKLFGQGRTPRAVLDDAVDSSNADILVFYLNDNVGMCYRVQRDRYLNEYIVTGTIPTVVDTSGLTMYGPIQWSYPGPMFGNSYYGYSVAIGGGGGVNAQLDSLTDTTPGVYRPLPNTHFRAMYISELPPGQANGGLIEIHFDKPVSLIEIEMLDSIYDGATVFVRDKDYRLLGQKALGKTVSGAPQLVQIAVEGIRTIVLLAPAFDTTTWNNLRFATQALPLPSGPDVWPPAANVYLEDVYKTTSGRVIILYSVRNPTLGTYSLHTKATVLYPFFLEVDKWQMKQTLPQSGILVRVFLYAMLPGQLNPDGVAPDAYTAVDSWKMTATVPLATSILVSIIIVHNLYDIDSFKMAATIPQAAGSALVVVIIVHSLYDIDSFKMTATIPQATGSLLAVVVIVHNLYDIDSFKMTHTIPQAVGSSLV